MDAALLVFYVGKRFHNQVILLIGYSDGVIILIGHVATSLKLINLFFPLKAIFREQILGKNNVMKSTWLLSQNYGRMEEFFFFF